MIKAVFIDPNDKKGIRGSGANYLMVAGDSLKKESWEELRRLGIDLSISIGAFGSDGCPANPESFNKLIEKIKHAAKFKPVEIWLDHFRFDGHWEAIERGNILEVHKPCEWCKGKDRVEILKDSAQKITNFFKSKVNISYFAVPFKTIEVPQMITDLGQDHLILGKIFNKISPMLYHRMIAKPVSYISNYIEWLSDNTNKPIIPIIQITNMPNLEVALPENEIKKAYLYAKGPPSKGVALFWWTNAKIISNTKIVNNLFSL